MRLKPRLLVIAYKVIQSLVICHTIATTFFTSYLGVSEIFRIVSEKDSEAMVNDIDVQVWSYSPTITPTMLEERLSNKDDMPYKLLLEFLRKVLQESIVGLVKD